MISASKPSPPAAAEEVVKQTAEIAPDPVLGQPSFEYDLRTSEATEDIALWAEREVWVDTATAIFTLIAAIFAFFAYRQTKRQAMASERQADFSKQELEHNREAMRTQQRASALNLRPHLVPQEISVNLVSIHPKALVVVKFEPRGASDVFEAEVGVDFGFRIPGEDEWIIGPPRYKPKLEPRGFFPANEEVKLRFDVDYDLELLKRQGDTWFELEVSFYIRWRDALHWVIEERWAAKIRILADRSGSASVERDFQKDSAPTLTID